MNNILPIFEGQKPVETKIEQGIHGEKIKINLYQQKDDFGYIAYGYAVFNLSSGWDFPTVESNLNQHTRQRAFDVAKNRYNNYCKQNKKMPRISDNRLESVYNLLVGMKVKGISFDYVKDYFTKDGGLVSLSHSSEWDIFKSQEFLGNASDADLAQCVYDSLWKN